MNKIPERALQYKDVCLIPELGKVTSRSLVDTSIELCDREFKLPVIPANMRAVIDESVALSLDSMGYFYIMHRFDIDTMQFVVNATNSGWNIVSISIGVKHEDYNLVDQIASNLGDNVRVDYITVDIAHGHCLPMRNMLKHIKAKLPNTCVIAGNVATRQATRDLAEWGADIVKVGIGQGNVCTTKDKTGFTIPMFTCVQRCAGQVVNYQKVPIIADGGIRCNGDIAKALVAGAELVMVGSMFSQCIDSPAATVTVNGRMYKQYFGSASEHNKRHKHHIEGVMKEVPANNMTYTQKLEEIQQDLQSSVSYAGGTDISVLSKTRYYKY